MAQTFQVLHIPILRKFSRLNYLSLSSFLELSIMMESLFISVFHIRKKRRKKRTYHWAKFYQRFWIKVLSIFSRGKLTKSLHDRTKMKQDDKDSTMFVKECFSICLQVIICHLLDMHLFKEKVTITQFTSKLNFALFYARVKMLE